MFWTQWGPWGQGTEVGEKQQEGGAGRPLGAVYKEAWLGHRREGGAELWPRPWEVVVSAARETQPQAPVGGGAQLGPQEDGAARPSAALRPSMWGPAALRTAQTPFLRPEPP